MLNGTGERGALSLASSPVKASSSPVRASPSPVRAPSSPLKSSLSSGRQRSPRRCQFAAPVEDARDKCGASWLCRRGAGLGEESDPERSPGPSAPLPQGCDDAAPPPKNCFRLVMLGPMRAPSSSLNSLCRVVDRSHPVAASSRPQSPTLSGRRGRARRSRKAARTLPRPHIAPSIAATVFCLTEDEVSF
ncbi:hypothetical protein ABMA27_004552 [Loxostege sticticalis]|uniref:Uncharacterized protein n=1 Tax=Loxostege sticticalis TaxID=481309 RepID=A0ABR3HNZ3_LOXSC